MRLKAITENDLKVIFSLIQDSITCYKWMYIGRKNFTCLLNRYAWEKDQCLRVQTLLTINNTNNIFQSISTKFKFFYLEYAEINQDNIIEIRFSNNNFLAIPLQDINVIMENTSDYYKTIFKPYSYNIVEQSCAMK